MNEFVAHYLGQGDSFITHKLEDHLRDVASLCRVFASEFSDSEAIRELAEISGLWHDLGKYYDDWQKYLRDVSGVSYKEEDEIAKVEKIDHSTAGAIFATNKLKDIRTLIISYCIMGHHAGLPDYEPQTGGSVQERLTKSNLLGRIELKNVPAEILNREIVNAFDSIKKEYFHFAVRLIFSCLVDADFLDTEKFMNKKSAFIRERNSNYNLKDITKTVDNFIDGKTNSSTKSKVNIIREKILNDCRNAAELAPGFFSLTVPPGGGKTLSGLSFALNHCLKQNKRRVIVSIPYNSIIEQNADIYKTAIGVKDFVVEHHSNLDPNKINYNNKLSAENWNAPVIVTTNVQLFESMFSAKPSKCRKLHNIMNSVIILDEVQMLPPEHLSPIIKALKFLVEYGGCTVVFCSATQPVFSNIGNYSNKIDNNSGIAQSQVREIIKSFSIEELNTELKRVNVNFSIESNKINTSDLCNKIHSEKDSVLCIVNTRKLCKEVAEQIPNSIHLSNNMCGAHKTEVIKNIKDKLRNGELIKVISTQLVEAGVDFDFPIVYKILSGMDSIAQAAGRCNREGNLKTGRVEVFELSDHSIPSESLLHKSLSSTRSMIRKYQDLCQKLSPLVFTKYFEDFYRNVNSFDLTFKDKNGKEGNVKTYLEDKMPYCQFRTVSKFFRLINSNTYPIIVKYNNELLLDDFKQNGLDFNFSRKLQRYIVNVYENKFNSIKSELEEIHGLWILKNEDLYTDKYGLLI